MEAADAADHVREIAREGTGTSEEVERFRTRTALVIAFLAMLLAIASLGGDNAAKEGVAANIHASDTWAFYQAKTIRQTANELAADALEADLLTHGPQLSAAARQKIQERIAKYRERVARYESEPDPKDPTKGEGRKELMAQARYWEAQRAHGQKQDPNFDYSTALFQIAIVLGSVAIIGPSRRILIFGLVLGVIATVLMINGFFLLFPLPGS